ASVGIGIMTGVIPYWIESLLTPCPWHLRRMGYLRELLGIRDRERRCRQAWAPHLERSRQVIRAAMSQCTMRRKAVILGSGLLLDVPVAELAGAFQHVVLVDVIHPWRTRRACRQFANV